MQEAFPHRMRKAEKKEIELVFKVKIPLFLRQCGFVPLYPRYTGLSLSLVLGDNRTSGFSPPARLRKHRCYGT